MADEGRPWVSNLSNETGQIKVFVCRNANVHISRIDAEERKGQKPVIVKAVVVYNPTYENNPKVNTN